MSNIGNKLYQQTNASRGALFNQGELATLTYEAFEAAVRAVQASQEETVTITFPVGWRPDATAINTTRTYRKEQLLERYQFLAYHELAVNGVIRLVTIIEALLGDIARTVVLKYPHKLGSNTKIPMQVVLRAASIEDVHLRATDLLLNELSYKSPVEFAEELKSILGFSLLECPAFHKYMEVKATRDIYIHNYGVANEIYVRKAGTHSRVHVGQVLPVDNKYFLESYEACLQLTEWIEKELHERWHSSERDDANQQQLKLPLKLTQSSTQPPTTVSQASDPAPEANYAAPEDSSQE